MKVGAGQFRAMSARPGTSSFATCSGNSTNSPCRTRTRSGRSKGPTSACRACNGRCRSSVTVDKVVNRAGTNPFDPANPTGGGATGTQPPPQPPPRRRRKTRAAPCASLRPRTPAPKAVGGPDGGARQRHGRRRGRELPGGRRHGDLRNRLRAGLGLAHLVRRRRRAADDHDRPARRQPGRSRRKPSRCRSASRPAARLLASPSSATVSIADNDSAPPPQTGALQFSLPGYETAEAAGAVTITVTRTGRKRRRGERPVRHGPRLRRRGSRLPGRERHAVWADGRLVAEDLHRAHHQRHAGREHGDLPGPSERPERRHARRAGPATVSIQTTTSPPGPCGPAGSAWAGERRLAPTSAPATATRARRRRRSP